ncbi:nesprin-4 isoform X2 [Peromyscus leucopus]|uniref:nesprin-4 isoform X2 n=1 Tax=Peromyscus leucopus TaxID=10041 RepID=UPI0018853FB8|nr:nesprin-4 isoform X2 [Peromyscus leucopus]
MALSPSLGHGFPSEPLSQPLGAPREPDITGCTIGPVPGEETSRSEQAQASLGPPEHITGELKDTEPAPGPPGLPLASSHEHQDGGKRCEHAVSGLEVLETEQDSLRLCLLGLSFQLQDLEQGLGSWTLAHSRIVQLQALQAELRGAAERVDALLAFGEGLAERSEPRLWASLERVLRALGTHRDTIFQRLWQLQTQLISYSLVLEKANLLDRDLEAEGDSDGPAPGGIWGPWAPGPAHVGAQPPETLSSSPSKASPEASGQEEASISQSTGCDAGGGPWGSPAVLMPDWPGRPTWCSATSMVSLQSESTAQTCVLNGCFPKMSKNIECLRTWKWRQPGYVSTAPFIPVCEGRTRNRMSLPQLGFPRL